MNPFVAGEDAVQQPLRGLLLGHPGRAREQMLCAVNSAGIRVDAAELAPTRTVVAGSDPAESWSFLLIMANGPDELDEAIVALTGEQPDMPILVLLQYPATADQRVRALRAGASDVLPSDPTTEELRARVRNCVDAFSFRRRQRDTIPGYEEEVRNAIGEILLREYETLYLLGKASEYKDRETGTHIARVAHYSRLIARMTGESEAAQEVLFHASALHDIGKLGIPDAVLLKPAPLDPAEWAIMRNHSTNGHAMLKDSQSSYLLTGAMIALTHHERYDGSGYPMGLRGGDIPLYGRIVCVADVFDALTTQRPYKSPWSIDGALEYLSAQRGRHFDPELVDAFVYNAPVVRDIFYRHADEIPERMNLID
ncbi:HD-GYP domain-containing protein [Salinispira pacifica]